MTPKGFCYIIILFICLLLNACATPLQKVMGKNNNNAKKNIAYNAVLTDPVIKKDFRNLRSIAIKGTIVDKETNPHFDENSTAKLNEATAVLLDRLQNHYHLTSDKYKVHAYIGRNKPDSCYQYYNTLDSSLVGKNCDALHACTSCSNYLDIVKSRTMKIVHVSWQSNSETTALIDTFRLSNGDFVFLGLDLSPRD